MDVGVLGNPRYHAVPMKNGDEAEELKQQYRRASCSTKAKSSRFEVLKTTSGNSLNIDQGSYVLKGWWSPSEKGNGTQTKEFFVILSLTHALSDRPGTLHVAHCFSEYLTDHNKAVPSVSQPIIDLQAQLLGDDYGAILPENDNAYKELQSFRDSLGNPSVGTSILPPEAMQNIPRELPVVTEGCIDVIYIELDADTTTQLVQACRNSDATVQGAISTAAVVASTKVLRHLSQDNNDSMMDCAI